jgi:hypothetical protein
MTMTDKEIVLAKYPDAYSRFYTTIYTVYIRRADLSIIGISYTTESEAWADARKNIQEGK